MYRDIVNNTSNSPSEVIPELKNVTYQIGKSDAIGGTTQGGLGVIKLQYWPAETYVYSNRRGTLVYNSVDMFLLMGLDGMYLLQPAIGDEVKFSFNNIFISPTGTANITYVESGIKVGVKNQIPYTIGYLGFRISRQITIPESGYIGFGFRYNDGRGARHIEKLCLIQYKNLYYPGYLHISDKACYVMTTAIPAGSVVSPSDYIGIIP